MAKPKVQISVGLLLETNCANRIGSHKQSWINCCCCHSTSSFLLLFHHFLLQGWGTWMDGWRDEWWDGWIERTTTTDKTKDIISTILTSGCPWRSDTIRPCLQSGFLENRTSLLIELKSGYQEFSVSFIGSSCCSSHLGLLLFSCCYYFFFLILLLLFFS
jgi:hypothetical protein